MRREAGLRWEDVAAEELVGDCEGLMAEDLGHSLQVEEVMRMRAAAAVVEAEAVNTVAGCCIWQVEAAGWSCSLCCTGSAGPNFAAEAQGSRSRRSLV